MIALTSIYYLKHGDVELPLPKYVAFHQTLLKSTDLVPVLPFFVRRERPEAPQHKAAKYLLNTGTLLSLASIAVLSTVSNRNRRSLLPTWSSPKWQSYSMILGVDCYGRTALATTKRFLSTTWTIDESSSVGQALILYMAWSAAWYDNGIILTRESDYLHAQPWQLTTNGGTSATESKTHITAASDDHNFLCIMIPTVFEGPCKILNL